MEVKSCDQQKKGRFDRLHCCLSSDHDGPCNFVVTGVLPSPGVPGGVRKRSDAVYEYHKAKRAKRLPPPPSL